LASPLLNKTNVMSRYPYQYKKFQHQFNALQTEIDAAVSRTGSQIVDRSPYESMQLPIGDEPILVGQYDPAIQGYQKLISIRLFPGKVELVLQPAGAYQDYNTVEILTPADRIAILQQLEFVLFPPTH
jgi:hypothetical protein